MIAKRTQTREQQGYPFVMGSLEPTMVRWSPSRRPWNRSNHLICYIDASGFLSIMFALFCLFACPYGMFDVHSHMGRPVDLAKVSHPASMRAAGREDALIVSIQRDGKIYCGYEPVSVEILPARIRQGISQSSEKKVYIHADARAKYGGVKEVLDAIRAAGIEKIGVLVDQRRATAPPL